MPVTKISDKLRKVSDSYTINMYDNGFMVEIGGRNDEDDWAGAKIICSTVEELVNLVQEAASMERE
jgi:ketol-acid reductoisomerase